mgnify:CR=1 FL=1
MVFLEYIESLEAYRATEKTYTKILSLKEKLFSQTQPNAMRYDAEKVEGSHPINSFDEYLIALERLDIDNKLVEAHKQMDLRKELLDRKKEELRQSKELMDKIYRLRYIDQWSVNRISRYLHYHRSQIFRILNKMEKMRQNATNEGL